MRKNKLTPEQEAMAEKIFMDARNLANAMGRIMETHEPAAQAGAVAMMLGAIILRDMEVGRFDNFEDAAEHYVTGALALHEDLFNTKGMVAQ